MSERSEFWLVVNAAVSHQTGCDQVESFDRAVALWSSTKDDNPTYPPSIIYHFIDGIPHDVTPGRDRPIAEEVAEKIEQSRGDNRYGAMNDRLAKIEERLFGKAANDDAESMRSFKATTYESLTKIEGRLAHLDAEVKCLRHENAEIAWRLDAMEKKPDPLVLTAPDAPICEKCGGIMQSIPRMGIRHVCLEEKPEPSSGAEAVAVEIYPILDDEIKNKHVADACAKAYRAAVAHYRKTVPHLTLKEIGANIGGKGFRWYPYESARQLHDSIAADRKEPE